MHQTPPLFLAIAIALAGCSAATPVATTERSVDALHEDADEALRDAARAVAIELQPHLAAWDVTVVSDALPLPDCAAADGTVVGESWFTVSGAVLLRAPAVSSTDADVRTAIEAALERTPDGWTDGTDLPVEDLPEWRSLVAARSSADGTVAVGVTFEPDGPSGPVVGVVTRTACTDDDDAPTLYDDVVEQGFVDEASLRQAATRPDQ